MNKQDWTYKKLGEVATLVADGDWIESKDQSDHGIRLIQTGNVGNGIYKSKEDSPHFISEETFSRLGCTEIFEGDCLVSRLPDPVGRACIVPNIGYRMITAVDCSIIRFGNNYLPKFFVNYSQSSNYRISINNNTTGTTRKRISRKNLEKILIPVPPLAEQERIVAELDLLSGIIEKKKEQLKAYDQLAQSIFYTMFGDPIDNPKGWETKTIGNTCTITCGQDYKTVEDENGKYPIYGTGGIMGWANQFRCPKDSVIIGRKGNINNPILVNADFWNVDTAFGVTPNNDVLSAIYFFFFCKEYDFTQHDVSVTIPSLRRTDILKIKLPVPPLSLQQEFAEKIEAIERQKALVQQSIEETQTMFDFTMDKYFG